MSNTLSSATKPYKSMPLRQLLIICFSNMTAYFDFLIYFYMAEVIRSTFFPASDNSVLMNLQMLTLFTAGYLSRPIGGLLIGRYGDIKGRKPALLISLSLLALTTLATACLPTYAQVGMLAPALFFIARLLQGMAFGAHAPLGWVYIAEHINTKNMAFYCSIVTASFFGAGLIANLFFDVLYSTHTIFELVTNAWRIPFVMGAMFSFIALLLWHRLEETPIFVDYKKNQAQIPKYLKIASTFRRFNALFLASLITFAISSLTIIVVLLLPQLILLKFSVDESLLRFSNFLGLVFLMCGCGFFGLMADKNGIGKTLMIGATALIFQILAFYFHLTTGSGDYILVMYAILGFCTGIIGLGPLILVQLFPTEIRLAAVSSIYNVIYALVGGLLPFALVYATNHVSFSPALYLTFIGMITFIVGLFIFRSPRFKRLDAPFKHLR